MKTLPRMDMYILKHSHNSGTDMKILHPRRNPWGLRIPWCYQTCPWIDVLSPMLKTTPILKDEQRTVFKLLLKHEEKNLKLTTKSHQNCSQNSAHQIQIQIWIKPQNSVLSYPPKQQLTFYCKGAGVSPKTAGKQSSSFKTAPSCLQTSLLWSALLWYQVGFLDLKLYLI